MLVNGGDSVRDDDIGILALIPVEIMPGKDDEILLMILKPRLVPFQNIHTDFLCGIRNRQICKGKAVGKASVTEIRHALRHRNGSQMIVAAKGFIGNRFQRGG